MILYLLPFITAFTSWLAVWSATMMLFSRVGKQKIGDSISSLIDQELSVMLSGNAINDPVIFRQLSPTIEKHLDNFLKIKLQEKLPVVATFMGESTLTKIKHGMMEEIEILLPEVIAQYTATIQQNDNMRDHISRKLNSIFEHHVNKTPVTSYLRKIAIITIAQGFVVGLILAFILKFINI